MDASSSYPFGQCLKSGKNRIGLKGVSLSSPNLGLIAHDIHLEYVCATNEIRGRVMPINYDAGPQKLKEKDLLWVLEVVCLCRG